MTTTVGASTSYQLTVPELSETADIQVALKLLAYGQSADPTNNADIEANSLIGYLLTGLSTKSNIASPTFTGTVTLPTQSTSSAPLRFVSGTLKSILVTGAMEYDGTKLYLTNNSSSRKTIAYVGDAGYTLITSGSIGYSGGATTTVVNIVSGRDFTEYKKLLLLIQSGATNTGNGTFVLRFNSVSSGYYYTYSQYSSTPTFTGTTSGSGFNITNGLFGFGVGKEVAVYIENPGSNTYPKNVSWQSGTGFGWGNASAVSASIASIGYTTSSDTPALSWSLYGIK